jgi:SAM-dependent methyltransferase
VGGKYDDALRLAGVSRTMPETPSTGLQRKETWAAGDFARMAHVTVLAGELLCESVDLRAGESVLDVATGTGNTALSAARRRAEVSGIDLQPDLLVRARARAEVEGLKVEFREGDAQALPFPEASFDVALSTFGAMFAPDQGLAAAELFRVVRPGGRIGLNAWTPDGFTGRQFALLDRFAAEPGAAPPPTRWGTESGLRELFPPTSASLESRRRFVHLRGDSPKAMVDFHRRFFGPVVRAFASLDVERQSALEAALLDLIGKSDRSGGGSVLIPSEYLEAVVTRR